MEIKWKGCHPSNYHEGRHGYKVKYIITHWIVGTLQSADMEFMKADERIASTHYGIGGEEIHQYVREEDTAYANRNYAVDLESISIEHEGGWLLKNGERFKPTDQIHETSAKLIADLCRKYSIPADRKHILRHQEVSKAYTECPGSLDVDKIVGLVKVLLDYGKGGDKMEEQAKRIFDFIKSKIKPEENPESAVRGWWESDRVYKERTQTTDQQLAKFKDDIESIKEDMRTLRRIFENGKLNQEVSASVSQKETETNLPEEEIKSGIKNLISKIYSLIKKPQDLYKALRRARNTFMNFLTARLTVYVSTGQFASLDSINFEELLTEKSIWTVPLTIIYGAIFKYIRTKKVKNYKNKIKNFIIKILGNIPM